MLGVVLIFVLFFLKEAIEGGGEVSKVSRGLWSLHFQDKYVLGKGEQATLEDSALCPCGACLLHI